MTRAALACVLLLACSHRPDPVVPDTGPRARDAGADAPETPDAATDGPGPAPRIVGLELDPPSAELVSRDGATVTQTFAARGIGPAGEPIEVTGVRWSVADATTGAIDPAGTFTANGVAGGATTVIAELAATDGSLLVASAPIVVRLVHHSVGLGFDVAAAEAAFTLPPVIDEAAAVRVLYPLDGTVMPRNVPPPDVQWEGGVSRDFYRVRLRKTHVEVDAIVRNYGAGYRFDHLVDAAAWHALAESDPDEPVVLAVDRYDGSRVVAGAEISITLARGVVAGQIYYWDLLDGTLLRIRGDAAIRDDFMPTPPASPLSGSRCIACHTVSRDGRWLAAELWGAGSTVSGAGVFDLTADLTGLDPPTRFDPSLTDFTFESFAPDGAQIAAVTRDGLEVISATSGARVARVPVPASMAGTHPAWSPDGRTLLYVAHLGDPPYGFRHGDLVRVAVGAGTTFGAPEVVHRGSDLVGAVEGGNADAYPTWSADGRALAFQHGPFSRSDQTAPDVTGRSPGALYLWSPEDGRVRRLDRALGGADRADSYLPAFSPFLAGGRYWLAFFSRRDYGNAQAGTRGTGRRQIWVTAIDIDSDAEDPSHPAYWLPGQDVTTENMSAYWAPQACLSYGEACVVSDACCSGSCRPDERGATVCQPPPPAECRTQGETCESSGDCCEPLPCDAHVCGAPLI